MKSYRAALLKREFTFLNVIPVDGGSTIEEVNDIKIQKGDNALLGKKGSVDSYSWCGGGHCHYTEYYAVRVEGGQPIVSMLKSAGYSATGSGDRNEWDADTIGEQLFERGINPDFIVECVKNDHDDNGNGEVTRFWTIYKMSRFDLVAHHQQKVDEAATVLKAEIAAVCA